MRVKIQHQMEVLNPVDMTRNMTALMKWQYCIFILHCVMKHDGVAGKFSFPKQDNSEWGSRNDPKK